MSTTDTQVLAALNAWTTAHEPTNLGGTLDNYAPETITAMRAALDAANLDADRLRDGVRELLAGTERCQDIPAENVAIDLRALIDGEAKG